MDNSMPPAEELGALYAAAGLPGLHPGATPGEILATVRNVAKLRRDGCDPAQEPFLRAEALRVWQEAGRSDAEVLWKGTDPKRWGASGAELQGRALELRDPPPAAEPVALATVLETLVRLFSRHVVLPELGAETLALWVAHTYVLDHLEASPVLALTSPEKRCGKTTTLRLLGAVVRRALSTASITAPALFRTVEVGQPTLLVDEADSMARSDELRAVLNAGHTRDTAWVLRTVGDDYEPRRFSTWCAKAVALVGKLWPALEDRSIGLGLRRRTARERVERVTRRHLADYEALRAALVRWARDYGPTLDGADPPVPDELHDRAADNWRPLLALADLAGGPWPERARTAARRLSGTVDEAAASHRIQLLEDLTELFQAGTVSYRTTGELCDGLAAREERPWGTWSRGKPITPEALGRLLRPFGIRSRQQWVVGENTRGYRWEDLEDAIARYTPLQPARPARTQAPQQLTGLFDPLEPAPPSVLESGANSLQGNGPSGSSGLKPPLSAGVRVPDPLPGSSERLCPRCGQPLSHHGGDPDAGWVCARCYPDAARALAGGGEDG